MIQRIYLDHNATTPLDPRVIQAILQELEADVGNPSSIHFHGQRARARLYQYRQTISSYLGVKPHEIIFTSGGTEGATLLLEGLLSSFEGGEVLTSNTEHSCIYQSLKRFALKGVDVQFLPAGLWGAVHPQIVREAIKPSTRLMVFMAVNNETGVKTDIEALATIAEEAKIPFIVDGVAWLGKESFTIPRGVSAMFFSGHKLHAPKGTGFLFCRHALKLYPLFVGGPQEFNRRAGSENLPGIAGLAKAVEILKEEQGEASNKMRRLRDQLEEGLKRALGSLTINGEGPRVVNTLNVSFQGVNGESLLMSLDLEGVSVSHGSACSSGALEPSRILLNMGISPEQAGSSIRFSVSRLTTEEEINKALEIIVKTIERLKQS